MNINLNNYEAYFLDYHEGSLSPALVKELMEFVAQHPELKEELESFEPIILKDAEGIEFNGKEDLKKDLKGINATNFEESAIDYVEGNLTPELQKELNTFILQNPHYKSELELFTKTKLIADTNIIFEDKFLLKKGRRKPEAYFYWSAAASIAIIIVSYFLLHKNPTPDGNIITKQNQQKDSNVVVKHTNKLIDTGNSTPKVLPNHTTDNSVKDNQVAASKNSDKHKHRSNPLNKNGNSSSVASRNRKANKLHSLPAPTQKDIPAEPENELVAFNGNLYDTSMFITNTPSAKEYMIIEPEQKEKKKNKFLVMLATITCKGLHTITGQHIEFEKKYDSDTTNIVAYQLDLGNKKYEFPVKE